MVRANASEGIYNDCTNVVIYKATSPEAEEKLGVYCWLTSGDAYTPVQIQTVKAHQYTAEGFNPIECFAGQVRIRGKRLSRQSLTLFRPNAETKCCGEKIAIGHTDVHGHFLIEPLSEGEYFALFDDKETSYTVNIGVVQGYQRCGGTHVELNFSTANECSLATYVDVDYDEKDCPEDDPACYRK